MTAVSREHVLENDVWVPVISDSFPVGIILIWSGSIASIPAGWQLCDGTNGTPNLVGRFVVCAGDAYAVGDTGGSTNHTHTFSGTTGTPSINQNRTTGVNAVAASNHTHTFSGETGSANNLPPYYALAFIKKMS